MVSSRPAFPQKSLGNVTQKFLGLIITIITWERTSPGLIGKNGKNGSQRGLIFSGDKGYANSRHSYHSYQFSLLCNYVLFL